jgi:hypothetical protein
LPSLSDYHQGRHLEEAIIFVTCLSNKYFAHLSCKGSSNPSAGSDKDPQVVKIVVSQFGAE